MLQKNPKEPRYGVLDANNALRLHAVEGTSDLLLEAAIATGEDPLNDRLRVHAGEPYLGCAR